MKKVIQILYGHIVDMGGMPVRQPLPTRQIEQLDPFLLIHHHTGKIRAGSHPLKTGVGPHPHRGFSPVTFIYQGGVHHRDSRGNDAEVLAGGVQWMDAGMGVIHSERPPKYLAENGGTQEIIQIWVNTPASKKMAQPNYIAVQKDMIPMMKPNQGDGVIQVVSGTLNDITGSVNPPLKLVSSMGKLNEGSAHTFSLESGLSTALYLLDGELDVGGHGVVAGKNLIVFEAAGSEIGISATQDTRFLLLAGEPLNEPLATYGPFVMNNQTQIMEAMRDYQQGKMGMLVEEL